MDTKLIDFTSLFDRFAIAPDYIYVTLVPWKAQSIQMPAPVTNVIHDFESLKLSGIHDPMD